MKYAILAGGHGSRFVKEGVHTPKPMVEVMGEPMIGRLIRLLQGCGAEVISIAANPRMEGFIPYLEQLRARWGNIIVNPVITENSYESLLAATDCLDGRFIGMTVDTVFPMDEFRSYIAAVEAMGEEESVMGLTRYIDDASPLYARIDGSGEIIDYRYGGEPFAEGAIVSAGLYGLSRRCMDAAGESGHYPESLSDFQRTLAVRTAIRVLPFEFTKAFDIDNLHDLGQANEFFKLSECSADV
ncbi:MAG: NTP transferase domain-containing protein [Muribaculaceae bacterium]|nr:NTP transferase domain-containing protein [Muribaculaceae bacterium]